MNRQHPIFSPVAIIGAILLLAGLAYGLFTSGGNAFSPGELSALGTIGQNLQGYPHHAAFGEDCTQCHAPFQGIEIERCERCHVAIGEQRLAKTGLHGQLQTADCAACHAEHQGRDFDSVALALDQFSAIEHAMLFPLTGAHSDLACERCHQQEQYVGTPSECVGCHAEPDIHQGLLGTHCANCHTVEDWHPAQLTRHPFELDHGKQGQIPCATCHTATFNDFTCTACHSDEEVAKEHDDLDMGPIQIADCAVCHPTGTEEEAERIMGER